MSVMKIEQWLSSLGFKQYTQLFIDNGYNDFELCKQLRENDLDLMGITIPIVKAEILSSVNSLKHAENAAHVYFSMDPNYWQTDGSINSASTFKSCLQEQNVSVAIQKSDDSADVYNIVLRELANDGVTPAKLLLIFPVTLKAKSVPIASKTLGRMHSYQKPKNIVSCITSTLSGSQSNINSGDF